MGGGGVSWNTSAIKRQFGCGKAYNMVITTMFMEANIQNNINIMFSSKTGRITNAPTGFVSILSI